jgi:hypothetical protein
MIFDQEIYREFKAAYKAAEAEGALMFVFRDQMFDLSYAKYLLEQLAWKWDN